MTNKELQKLFRKKLDNRNIAYNPEGWARMETMLDAGMPVATWMQSSAKWVKGLTAASVTGISIWFMMVDTDNISGSIPSPTNQQETVTNVKTNQDPVLEINQPAPNLEYQSQNTTATTSATAVNTKNKNTPTSTLLAEGATNSISNTNVNNLEVNSGNTFVISSNALELKSKEASLSTAKTESINTPNAIATDSKRYTKNKQKNWRFGFNLDIITSKNNTISTEGNTTTTVPGWALGFSAARKLGTRFSLQSGLNYSIKKTDGSYTFVDTDYGFGSDIMTTTVNTKSLHLLEVPLTLQYHLGLRHQLKAGFYGSYLLSTACNVKQELDNGFEIKSNTENMFLTETAFNNFDGGLVFGYAYSLDHNLQLGINSWVGLTNVYKEDFSPEAQNFSIRFSLNYWL